jgi:hydroxymethylbilane synthase
MKVLRLGTRASNLALTQSRYIARKLERAWPGLRVELIEIATTGDQVKDKALKSFGGAGVFVKELEQALHDKRVDIAVHSLKDVPTEQPRGLVIGAILGREDTRDCAIIPGAKSLAQLPKGSLVGSGSQRRRAQLARLYPQLAFAEIRGNVETRIAKVERGDYAATILARAGLKRLGLAHKAAQILPLSKVLPAPGQGALAIECRSSDRRTRSLLNKIHNAKVALCVSAERELLAMLGGGCNLPLGALGTLRGKTLQLRAFLSDGTNAVEASGSVPARGVQAARQLANKIRKQMILEGANKIVTELGSES